MKLAELSDNSFGRKNVAFWGSKHTLTPPTYFQVVMTQSPWSAAIMRTAIIHEKVCVTVLPTCVLAAAARVIVLVMLNDAAQADRRLGGDQPHSGRSTSLRTVGTSVVVLARRQHSYTGQGNRQQSLPATNCDIWGAGRARVKIQVNCATLLLGINVKN